MAHVKPTPPVKEEPLPVADDRQRSQAGLPPVPPQQQQQPQQFYQHHRPSIAQHHHQPHHHPQSPHQPPSAHHPVPSQFTSPQIHTHNLSGQQGPYIAPSQHPSSGQPDVSYYTHPSPYSTNSAAGSYSSSAEHSVDPTTMAATAAMNSRHQPPTFYATPQSASPASVQSPHDQYGRPTLASYGHMYHQLAHSAAQQSPYGQHAVAQQPGMISTNFMPPQQGHPMSQHPSHPATPALNSPSIKLQQTPVPRQQPVMSPSQQTPSAQSSGTPGLHQGPMAGSSSSSTAAPGPIPATTPLVVRQDNNGVQWIAFEYSRDRVKMEYTIRCDVESVDVNSLPTDFKNENCVYPRACCPKDQYKGNRLHYESECNTVGWALAQLNPCLRAKRGLIQRAVDSWRNSNQDPRLRSRRVRRQAKMNTRQKNAAQQHVTHLAGPGAPPPSAAGMVTPNMASALPAATPRPQSMSMAAPGMVHHQQPGPTGPDDVSGNDYNSSGQTHHHQAPHENPGSLEVKPVHNFYAPYPQAANQGMSSQLPPGAGGSAYGHPHGAHPVANPMSKSDDDATQDNIALFGDLPEAKRRKFILVDDPQRGTRVRVRVMLDQVRMHEMPDSYRRNNSVYPRSWFPTEMQSPPTSPRRSRWADDIENEEGISREQAKTQVPVPIMDGSEVKLPVPKMTRGKRSREVVLNDLGYRMSWSQSRVFSGRTLFLQRSLDAYRNKMRSTMVGAGQDVTQVAPHFETRVGKRKFLEWSKNAKRDGSP